VKPDTARILGRSSRAARLAMTLPVVLLFGGCSWFTDFKEQPKIDPWETAADTIAFRGNPQGSVPIYGTVAPGYAYDRAPLPGAIKAMAGLSNPTPADPASVNRGRLQFQVNCAPCHGSLGMGNGSVVKYGMPPIPIGAGTRAANEYTDGYIFGMIRNGRGLMPSYNRIEEADRWDLINYLRSIQGKGTVPADTSHGRPGETGRLLPGASRMGPTRPVPYYGHPGPLGSSATTVSPAAHPSSASPESKP
jgi:mono/diheme cytochrome c family protein